MWFLYAVLSALTASLVAIFGKVGLEKIDPTLATTIRSIIISAVLIAVSFSFKKFEGFSLGSFNSSQWMYIVLAALAGAASWLFYFLALQKGAVTRVAAIDRLSIVFVIIFAAVFLGEVLSWKSVFGGALIAFGALLMTL